MPLQKFIGNIYSVCMEILLWVMPIAGAVAGIIAADYLYQNTFLMLLAGILVGIILDVMFFGPVIMLLNIRSSLKNIEGK